MQAPGRNPYPHDELRARRERRFRMERVRAWVILLGGVGFIVLLGAHHDASAFALVLAVVLASMFLRRLGS